MPFGSRIISRSAATPASRAVLLLLAVFWSAITLLAIGALSWSAVKSFRAAAYPTSPGTVIASSLKISSGRHGPMYGAEVRFRFQVAGQTYESGEYRYNSPRSSDSTYANSILAQFPVGAAVTVHYNPANPNDAVLQTGIDGTTRFFVFFITPFAVVMLALWHGAVHSFTGRDHRGPRFSQDSAPRADLSMGSAVSMALAVLALGSFISVFPWAFFSGGSVSLLGFALNGGLLLALAIGFAIWFAIRKRAGDYDLFVDIAHNQLILPAELSKTVPDRILSISDVVAVEPLTKTSKRSVRHEVTLKFKQGGHNKAVVLCDADSAEAAADFCRDLRRQLRL